MMPAIYFVPGGVPSNLFPSGTGSEMSNSLRYDLPFQTAAYILYHHGLFVVLSLLRAGTQFPLISQLFRGGSH